MRAIAGTSTGAPVVAQASTSKTCSWGGAPSALDSRRARAPAHRRLPVRRGAVRDRRAARLGFLVPLHALPAPDRDAGVRAGADRARLAADRPGRASPARLPAGG